MTKYNIKIKNIFDLDVSYFLFLIIKCFLTAKYGTALKCYFSRLWLNVELQEGPLSEIF